jgi:hypothetical protein
LKGEENVFRVKINVISVTKHHAMKVYGGPGCRAAPVFNLGIGWTTVKSFTLRFLYPLRKSPQ